MSRIFTTDPRRIDWVSTALLIGGLVLMFLFLVAFFRATLAPKVDPALGRATVAETAARAQSAQKGVEQGSAALATAVMGPIAEHQERTKPHVAKLRARAAAPALPGALPVPDDDAYRSLCEPGGLYQGHQGRDGECGKLAGHH